MNNPNNLFRVTFYSGIGEVTGANFLLEAGGGSGGQSLRILVDCGLAQGEKMAQDENRQPFAYDVPSIDYLFITHAHLDHVGRIPKLVKDGFKGVIFSILETRELAKLILADALSLLTKEAAREGLEPLYNQEDVNHVFPMWQTIPYHVETPVGDGSSGLSVYLRDAGHILGSTMYRFTYKDPMAPADAPAKNIVFTGDLGNSPTPLLRDTEPVTGAQYIVMESVYGDRNHEPKDERRKKLEDIINETAKRGGTVLIPSFSLERTQVILYELEKLVEGKLIPSTPVFVDSPLAIAVTDIYRKSENLFNDAIQAEIRGGETLFNFPKLEFTVTADMSRNIDHAKAPKIILAGSGMSTGGRMLHHEVMYLSDPKNTIIFVGYQGVGTLGRTIADGAKHLTIAGVPINIQAQIETILGYSAHKDSDHLVEFVATAQESLKKVFVVMGEPKASTFLAQRLRDELGVKALYPEKGVGYDL
jgi:metallo-beta-lactamase family protein